ncbi:MAG: Xaa-Pro peptidase family protein [Granulicella sp.]
MSNDDRRVRMRLAMEAQKLDTLILRLPENVLLLSEHWPMIGAAYLVFPLEGKATCILPACYEQDILGSLEDCDPKFFSYGGAGDPPLNSSVRAQLKQAVSPDSRRIGYEGNFEVVAPSWNAAESMVPAADALTLLRETFTNSELIDVTQLLITGRMRKTQYEIERLDIASEISCFALAAFQEAVEVGICGVELAAIVEHAAMVKGTGYKGSVRVRAFAQVTTGALETSEAHRPNVISTTRKMEDGEFAVLELGLVADGYWADRTRVRIAGTARDPQIKIYETVRRAQEAAVAAICTGVRARDVDRAARSVIEDAGFGPYFPHVTGHGLGFRYHESFPILGPNSDDILEEGAMTSVEPGIYTTAFGGCRIEDDVIVTNEGPRILGPYLKNLN